MIERRCSPVVTRGGGGRLKVPVLDNCPYADEEILEAVMELNEEAKQKINSRDYLAKLYKAF